VAQQSALLQQAVAHQQEQLQQHQVGVPGLTACACSCAWPPLATSTNHRVM
jgi:hypothetical protein